MTTLKYSKLTPTTKGKLNSTLVRLHKSGITQKEALALSDKDLKQALGFKGKKTSFEGLKRNIKNLSVGINDKDKLSRKEGLRTLALPKYAKFGYRGKRLSIIKKELSKAIGLNIFFDISKEVQTKFNVSTKQSFKLTNSILERAKKNYKKLSVIEKIILSYFS